MISLGPFYALLREEISAIRIQSLCFQPEMYHFNMFPEGIKRAYLLYKRYRSQTVTPSTEFSCILPLRTCRVVIMCLHICPFQDILTSLGLIALFICAPVRIVWLIAGAHFVCMLMSG